MYSNRDRASNFLLYQLQVRVRAPFGFVDSCSGKSAQCVLGVFFSNMLTFRAKEIGLFSRCEFACSSGINGY